MRKRILSLAMVICMLCSFVPVIHAAEIVDSGTCGENVTWTLDDEGTMIVSGTGEMEDYIQVMSPFRKAYIKKLIIEQGITSIGMGLFAECKYLESVDIADSVLSIPYNSFGGCSELTSVILPKNLNHIGWNAFSQCISLENIDIPASVDNIEKGAFSKCTSLREIYVDSQNEKYISKDGVLFNKDGTTLLQYPAGKEDYKYLLPDSVVEIEEEAFYGCTKLERIFLHSGIEEIKNYTFANSKSLEYVYIENGNTYIGYGAFTHCTSLQNINISSNTIAIGGYAFSDCNSLKKIYIPRSVMYINNWAFDGCSSLTDVYYEGSESEWNNISIQYQNDPLLNAAIHYNATSIPVPSVTSAEAALSDIGYVFDIDITDVPYTCELLTAVYYNGRLTGFASTPVTSADTQKIVTVPAENADSAKVFIWDSAGAVKPLCGAVTADIE